MDRVELRRKIFDACIAAQEKALNNLQQVMDESQQIANEAGPPKDRYDPFRAQMMRRRDMYAQQYQKASGDLLALRGIKVDEVRAKVEQGAVVITDSQRLVVAAGIGKIEVEGESYFAISPSVPVYLAMKGKKAGEPVSFNQQTYLIREVF